MDEYPHAGIKFQALKITRGDVIFQGKSIQREWLVNNKFLDNR
jgi:hypothetical protein